MNNMYDHSTANLLGREEQDRRLASLQASMEAAGIRASLVSSPANIFYLTGRVFRGYVYIATGAACAHYLVRRPRNLAGRNVHFISKPAEIIGALTGAGVAVENDIALELGSMSYSDAVRLASVLGMSAPTEDISPLLKSVRAVKTEAEQNLLRISGRKHTLVYRQIPHLYREGMSDIEFQIEIERASRLGGCLGQFRVAGTDMEIFMGNVLTGDNGDTPSPYDFAMGGAGQGPSLPVGADGTVIRPGVPVMVDVNGNYTGYMTDMTRCFAVGNVSGDALKANRLSVDICAELAGMMTPGAAAADLYNRAVAMAEEAGMADFFMGYSSHAGFVGHGVGIEINELPVIAPRSRDILRCGNVIALEPKFVLPGIGAVGVENTYIVHDSGPGELITDAPQNIAALE